LSQQTLTTQADELLKEIEQQTDAACRAALAAAEKEADDILSKARRDAHRQARDAIGKLRQEGNLRLTRARAQIETDDRGRAQRQAGEVIQRAWPMLTNALLARWKDSSSRKSWIEGAARAARDRIRSNVWTVEHPLEWSAEDRRRCLSGFAGAEDTVRFVENPRIPAGLRIAGSGARLDATPDGLLRDRVSIAAQFLAGLDSHA
jgi:F0F1-type ATP synthase membrane subunit b/b'